MVGLKKQEDRPTPPEVYNKRIYLTACATAAAAIMIGYDSAFIGGTIALKSFKEEFGLATKTTAQTSFISSNIVSTYQGGCFFGAILGYPLGFYLGRKRGLIASALIFILGAGIMLAATSERGLGPIYAGRIIAGLGIGAASNLSPLFVAEIAPAAIRGQLVGIYEICWQIGGIVGFWINYGVSENITPSRLQWEIPFALQLVPGGLFAIGLIFVKESPRWLFGRGRREEAIANLAYLRNLPADHKYVQDEVAQIETQLENDTRACGNGFFSPVKAMFASRKLTYRMLLGTSLFIFQNGTGINAINYYSPTVFKSLGIVGTNTGLLTTGVFGVIKGLGALIWLFFLIDHWGRKPLFIFGAAGGAFSMYVIGAYIAIAKPQLNPTTTLPSSGRAAVAFFYIWTIFYAVTWNGTPWVVNSEIYPNHVRIFGQCCAAGSNWLYNFVISRATPYMFTSMGYGVYIFFASMMVISIPYIYFLLPETKNVPLEAMERLFASNISPRRAHKIVMAELIEENGEGRQTTANNVGYVSSDKASDSQQEKYA